MQLVQVCDIEREQKWSESNFACSYKNHHHKKQIIGYISREMQQQNTSIP